MPNNGTQRQDPLDAAVRPIADMFGGLDRANVRAVRIHTRNKDTGKLGKIVCRLEPSILDAGPDAIWEVMGPGAWEFCAVDHQGRAGKFVQLPEVAGRARPIRFDSDYYQGPPPEDLVGTPWGPPGPPPAPAPAAAAPAAPGPLAGPLEQVLAMLAKGQQDNAQAIASLKYEMRAQRAAPAQQGPTALEQLMVKVLGDQLKPRESKTPEILAVVVPAATSLAVVGLEAYIDARKAAGQASAFDKILSGLQDMAREAVDYFKGAEDDQDQEDDDAVDVEPAREQKGLPEPE